jgi:hypothetical protein
VIYFFYPETKDIKLEDIPMLFHKAGITGGVFASREEHLDQASVHGIGTITKISSV